MNIIFLDIDGVLNCHSTKERIRGMYGIDPAKVHLLRQIVDVTNSVIVLTSTWKLCYDPCADIQRSHDGQYLAGSLAAEGLSIYDKTRDSGLNRGYGILCWMDEHPELTESDGSFVILDDEEFDYPRCFYRENKLSRYWIQTSFYKSGLRESHVRRAIELMESQKNF